MNFKSLRWQLLLSSCVAVIVIACLIALAAGGYKTLAIILAVLLAAYIILVNIWFARYVVQPISELTGFARRIASGSYGIKVQKHADNEIGALTDEINEMSEKVAQADKATTEFVSQISHELRTPLTAITGWSETLQYDPAIQGDSLRGVCIITKEADRLTSMVTDLLEFTRIQDGRFNLRVELIDISAELEDAIFTYGELMKQAGIEVRYNAPDYDIPPVSADPERLKQVFLNLLDNATKHGGDGKLVEITLRATGGYVLISIRDHGHGIPESELPYVKNRFYKGSSKNRGSGIGLAVCDEIITRHGGALVISNADDGGCIAAIRLPMNKE
ncbi:MAG: HAMP domain-containing histidine kinase [Oscillospiraceae bacterium]|nr:HAMP domain-containing histidine kinase [Oscillospiraceae bacterium]